MTNTTASFKKTPFSITHGSGTLAQVMVVMFASLHLATPSKNNNNKMLHYLPILVVLSAPDNYYYYYLLVLVIFELARLQVCKAGEVSMGNRSRPCIIF